MHFHSLCKVGSADGTQLADTSLSTLLTELSCSLAPYLEFLLVCLKPLLSSLCSMWSLAHTVDSFYLPLGLVPFSRLSVQAVRSWMAPNQADEQKSRGLEADGWDKEASEAWFLGPRDNCWGVPPHIQNWPWGLVK